MPELTVYTSLASTAYVHMHIYHDGTHIGDYEKSSPAHEERKRTEIQRSARFLVDHYKQHGKFVVRWNGHDRTKEVRKYQEGAADPGRETSRLDVIPEKYWKY
jgi:hypothetical protein